MLAPNASQSLRPCFTTSMPNAGSDRRSGRLSVGGSAMSGAAGARSGVAGAACAAVTERRSWWPGSPLRSRKTVVAVASASEMPSAVR